MKNIPGILIILAALAAGCNGMAESTSGGMQGDPEKGLVVVLPGIEGQGFNSDGVQAGLHSGGVDAATPVYQWGRPVPLAGPLLNQMDVLGNRAVAEHIAQFVAEYQDGHPGRPVFLIGHSGGGGVAVFTAEALSAMPGEHKVEGLILLSASISKVYDCRKALKQCRRGIVNFYSNLDIALLGVGTTLLGNVDGIHGPSAGETGFDKLYPNLYQVPWSSEMSSYGNNGHHMESCNPRFISQYVARWVVASAWPAR